MCYTNQIYLIAILGISKNRKQSEKNLKSNNKCQKENVNLIEMTPSIYCMLEI